MFICIYECRARQQNSGFRWLLSAEVSETEAEAQLAVAEVQVLGATINRSALCHYM